MSDSLFQEAERIVRERMNGMAGHGMDHVQRVVSNARLLQQQVGGNSDIVDLAALLHDIGDAKFHNGRERSAEFARDILEGLEAKKGVIDHVAHIVDNISFRKGFDSGQLSLEGKIVQDADRLDALGAIGIVRTIEYGAAQGQPFYTTEPEEKCGIGHFHEKLFRLKALMNTEAARQMAEDREQYMQGFVSQYLKEWRLAAPATR